MQCSHRTVRTAYLTLPIPGYRAATRPRAAPSIPHRTTFWRYLVLRTLHTYRGDVLRLPGFYIPQILTARLVLPLRVTLFVRILTRYLLVVSPTYAVPHFIADDDGILTICRYMVNATVGLLHLVCDAHALAFSLLTYRFIFWIFYRYPRHPPTPPHACLPHLTFYTTGYALHATCGANASLPLSYTRIDAICH